VADADHRGLAGSVEVAAALFVDNPAAFATNCDGVVFPEIARKKRSGARGRAPMKIVADELKTAAFVR
jgi:hypothetical protein